MANQVTIGRNPQSTIVVGPQYNTVSGNHATITRNGNTFTLEDHSTNGSYVNGVKYHNGSVQINLGDKVTLGQQYTLDLNEVISLLGGHAVTQRQVTPATVRVAKPQYAQQININIGGNQQQEPVQARPVQPRPVQPQEEYHENMPDKHMGLAIFALIMGFSLFIPLILSIIAIVNASNVESRWRAGDYDGAREASSKAQSLSWWSIVLSFAMVFVYMATVLA